MSTKYLDRYKNISQFNLEGLILLKNENIIYHKISSQMHATRNHMGEKIAKTIELE